MPTDSGPDYYMDDVLEVADPAQLRALGSDARTAIVHLLGERARSNRQLAEELGIPKGTVGHHLKTLEQAGLIRVVRTRQVRALTEKFYGRTARLFILRAGDPADAGAVGAAVLRRAAEELEASPETTVFGFPKVRLAEADARRLERRLNRLFEAFRAAESPDGEPHALVGALFRRARA